MPQIPSDIQDTAVYLYPSKEDAENCVNAGGSGFLLVLPHGPGKGDGGWIYVVTNAHVADKFKTVRLNTIAGATGTIEPKVWIKHPDRKTDLAIADLGYQNTKAFRCYLFMPPYHFIDKTRLIDYEIGVGDNCYMVGRFVNHEGYQRNLPTVRFGMIAQMPGEPIFTAWGVQEEAYLVEMRSISGFSGSPVIVRVSSRRMHQGPITKDVPYDPANDAHFLLGVDCGHSTDKDKTLYHDQSDEPLEEYKIEYNTGLSIVIPAWKLQELVDCDEATKMREEDRRAYQKRVAGTRLDVKEGPTQLTKPKKGAPARIPLPTRDQFLDDLAKVTRKRGKD